MDNGSWMILIKENFLPKKKQKLSHSRTRRRVAMATPDRDFQKKIR